MVSAPPRPVCPSYRSFLLIRPQNSPPGATMSTVNFYTWADWYYVLISNKMVSFTITENSWNINHSITMWITSSANESHGDGYFLVCWSKHWYGQWSLPIMKKLNCRTRPTGLLIASQLGAAASVWQIHSSASLRPAGGPHWQLHCNSTHDNATPLPTTMHNS